MDYYYRAANSPIIRVGDCLTDDIEIAREYADQRGYSTIYRVTLSPTTVVAGDRAIRAADRSVDTVVVYDEDGDEDGTEYQPTPYEGAGYVYAAMDRPEVRDVLVADGYRLAEFDEPWGNERGQHHTLVILDPTIVASIAADEVPA
jgi:hypothetical protein